jgi:hypothetical protein
VWIQRGENRGRVIRHHNVVRDIAVLGHWSGAAVQLDLPLERLAAAGRDHAAVLVQRQGSGEILVATEIDLRSYGSR